MILTDKALKDFYSKIYYTEDTNQVDETEEELIQEESKIWFNYQDERFQNALIIEFFDEKGVWENIFYEVYIDSTPTTKFNEILNKAILKANGLYNKN